MPSPFCEVCGTLITPQRIGSERKLIYWCPKCQREIAESNNLSKQAFKETTFINHSEKDVTRILENEPPPIPKLLTQSYEQRKKSRCLHPKAIFQGFYQFSSGDEASRKYWYCPDCGQIFRYSGKVTVKNNRKIIHTNQEKKLEKRG